MRRIAVTATVTVTLLAWPVLNFINGLNWKGFLFF